MQVYNISFGQLTDEYVEILHKMGLLRDGGEVHRDTLLPMIDRTDSPESVRDEIRNCIKDSGVKSEDAVILSGHPDVVYYIIEALPVPKPLILSPLGRTVRGKFRIQGFREIIVEKRAGPALHVLYGSRA